MKPPKTVTLIDLEGLVDVIPVAEIKKYAEDFRKPREQLFSERNGYYIHDAERWGFMSNQVALMLKGLAVGHFNDLAIYQTTLGKYWEVAWYENSNTIWEEWSFEIEQRQHPTSMHWLSAEKDGEVFSFRFDGFNFAGSDSKKRPYLLFMSDQPFKHEENVQSPSPSLVYPKFVKYFTKIKPSSELFIKHYPDVFSKLTPWNGE